jgi:hypothetical protein
MKNRLAQWLATFVERIDMVTGSGRKKFLDPALLAEAVGQVGALAKAEGVRVALIGGFALQLYGSDRLTGDVDFAAEESVRALPRGTALSFGGEQTEAPNGVPVDIVVRHDDYAPLYADAVEKATRVRGVPVLVARPEHLAAMKMVASRVRDDADLEFLIASGTVDPTKARRIIRKYLGPYAADEFDRVVEVVAWKTSRGRV